MSIRKIDAFSLMDAFRREKPEVYEGDNGYDQGALDMWKLLYAAVKASPTLVKTCNGCSYEKDSHLHKHCDTCSRRFQDHYKREDQK